MTRFWVFFSVPVRRRGLLARLGRIALEGGSGRDSYNLLSYYYDAFLAEIKLARRAGAVSACAARDTAHEQPLRHRH
jgi:hypothetical protein